MIHVVEIDGRRARLNPSSSLIFQRTGFVFRCGKCSRSAVVVLHPARGLLDHFEGDAGLVLLAFDTLGGGGRPRPTSDFAP